MTTNETKKIAVETFELTKSYRFGLFRRAERTESSRCRRRICRNYGRLGIGEKHRAPPDGGVDASDARKSRD